MLFKVSMFPYFQNPLRGVDGCSGSSSGSHKSQCILSWHQVRLAILFCCGDSVPQKNSLLVWSAAQTHISERYIQFYFARIPPVVGLQVRNVWSVIVCEGLSSVVGPHVPQRRTTFYVACAHISNINNIKLICTGRKYLQRHSSCVRRRVPYDSAK